MRSFLTLTLTPNPNPNSNLNPNRNPSSRHIRSYFYGHSALALSQIAAEKEKERLDGRPPTLTLTLTLTLILKERLTAFNAISPMLKVASDAQARILSNPPRIVLPPVSTTGNVKHAATTFASNVDPRTLTSAEKVLFQAQIAKLLNVDPSKVKVGLS